MKRFSFSLEQVLKVKKIREKERQRELSTALMQFDKETDKLDQMLAEELQAMQSLHNLQKGKESSVVINTLYCNLDGRQVLRELQKETVQQAQNIVDQKRLELVHASREKKILERLKEKQYTEYLENAENEEQKFIDQVAITSRFHMNIQD